MVIIILILVLFGLVIGTSIFMASHSYKFDKEVNKFTPEKYGFDFQEIKIPTQNNKNLYGWWVPAENPNLDNKPTIIIVHGWSRNVDRALPFIKQLHPAGYNLLAFDSRCHGRSDDDTYSSMLKFMEDIRASIDYAQNLPNVDLNRIELLGLSIGGAASILAAALDKRIKSVITVGAFSSPKKVMEIQFKNHHIPKIPFIWIIFKYMEFRIGQKFDDIAPVNNIAKSNAKFFLIHGVNDVTVPIEQADELFNAAQSNMVKLWRVDGKGHSDCNHHPEFWDRVTEFHKNN